MPFFRSKTSQQKKRFSQTAQKWSVSEGVTELLYELGVRHCFGITGGSIVPLVDAFNQSRVEVTHFRHESGAAFAAAEASLLSGRPTVVFTTTGPGLCNALNGIVSARIEGAKVILFSGWQGPSHRGMFAFQETSWAEFPISDVFSGSNLFDYAIALEHTEELENVAVRLANGVSRPGRFVAHISISPSLQTKTCDGASRWHRFARADVAPPACAKSELDRCADLIAEEDCYILAGFGASGASAQLKELAETRQCPVMTTPRGNGVFPAGNRLFLGSTGLGGHESLSTYLRENPPRNLVVLGTKMGEFSTHWDSTLVPENTLIHVDINREVFGRAYPQARTMGICADIPTFLEDLIPIVEKKLVGRNYVPLHCISSAPHNETLFVESGKIHPAQLMAAVQEHIVEVSDAILLCDVGNAFCWANRTLAFNDPHRYRTTMSWGSVGYGSAGVLGAALGTGKKAITLAGDGAMLMNSEISTAVKYGLPVVWIVLNDGQYGMIYHGMEALGYVPEGTGIPEVDFVQFAKTLGADGVRVEHLSQLDEALQKALEAEGPFVVDVIVDPSIPPPLQSRIDTLLAEGSG